MERIAKIVSWVFLPLLTPVFGMALALYLPSEQDYFSRNSDCLYTIPGTNKLTILLMFFFFSALTPAVIFYNLKVRGKISTIEIDDRKERNMPITIMFLSCLALFLSFIFLVGHLPVPKFFFSYPLAGMVSSLAFYFLTQWKKVSLHTGGIGIMTGFLISYAALMESFPFWTIPAAIVVSGLVGSARMYLGKHTLLEVTIGWFTGTFLTFAVNYFY